MADTAAPQQLVLSDDAAWDEAALDLPPELGGGEADSLTLTIDGWEGPLHLLLDLARRQKVDLRRISILALVDQYLEFVERAGAQRLELAADYLVMAAWLAWLKSLLLLPRDPEIQPSPEEIALRLQLRLQRLSAMREAGARLMARDRLGRDVFVRGAPEGLRTDRQVLWDCDLFALIQAYGTIKQRTAPVVHMVRSRPVMTLENAIARVEAMIGAAIEWTELSRFLPAHDAGSDPRLVRSALASSFVAALELAKQGKVEIAQAETFAPLMLRKGRG
jgi:segregation and condensation protein A